MIITEKGKAAVKSLQSFRMMNMNIDGVDEPEDEEDETETGE